MRGLEHELQAVEKERKKTVFERSADELMQSDNVKRLRVDETNKTNPNSTGKNDGSVEGNVVSQLTGVLSSATANVVNYGVSSAPPTPHFNGNNNLANSTFRNGTTNNNSNSNNNNARTTPSSGSNAAPSFSASANGGGMGGAGTSRVFQTASLVNRGINDAVRSAQKHLEEKLKEYADKMILGSIAQEGELEKRDFEIAALVSEKRASDNLCEELRMQIHGLR